MEKQKKDKVILIIDKPENCYDCKLQYDCYCCGMTNTGFFDKDNFDPCEDILPNCPLSPIPERKKLRQYADNTAFNIESMLAYQYSQGWNDCIEEIKEKN